MAPAKRRLILPRRRWRYPAGIERDYARVLRAVARALADATRQHIGIITSLLASRQDSSYGERKIILCHDELVEWLLINKTPAILRQDETESEYVLRLIRETYDAIGATPKAVAQAARIAQQVRGYNKGEFYDVLRSALKVDIFAAEPDLRRLVDEWTANNVRLIKSIPDQYFDKLQGVVSRGLQQGALAIDMGKEIEDLYGVTSRRAQLIARDQVATLNGLISQERQMAAGITFYMWSTSKDARVRDSHAEREGRYFAWPGTGVIGRVFNGKVILPPPPDGPPGVPINCRCVALPVVDTGILNNQQAMGISVGEENSIVIPFGPTGPKSGTKPIAVPAGSKTFYTDGTKNTVRQALLMKQDDVDIFWPEDLDTRYQSLTPGDITSAVKAIPPRLRSAIREIQLVDYRNPFDYYWATKYNIPNAYSFACEEKGKIVIFANKEALMARSAAEWSRISGSVRKKAMNMLKTECLPHEAGHSFDSILGAKMGVDRISTSSIWSSIMKADREQSAGFEYCSTYAKTAQSSEEDFADAVKTYLRYPEAFKHYFPNRFKFLEKELGP